MVKVFLKVPVRQLVSRLVFTIVFGLGLVVVVGEVDICLLEPGHLLLLELVFELLGLGVSAFDIGDERECFGGSPEVAFPVPESLEVAIDAG